MLRLFIPFFFLLLNSWQSVAEVRPKWQVPEIPVLDLEHEIARQRLAVPEFQVFKKLADQANLKVWVFGGTAAAFAHFVRLEWLQDKNRMDSLGADRRFFSLSNILLPDQDIDLVVDGPVEQIQKFIKTVHGMGGARKIDVRPLAYGFSGEPGLLDDGDFLKQNNDSLSTTLIELTDTQRPLLALHSNEKNVFLSDIAAGKIHFFRSEKHFETQRAKAGKNPEIFSVIRFLSKMFRYGLSTDEPSFDHCREIVAGFVFNKGETESYVNSWLRSNSPKMLLHIPDYEYAFEVIDLLGFRPKLEEIALGVGATGLAYFVRKEALKTLSFANSRDAPQQAFVLAGTRRLRDVLRERLGREPVFPEDALFTHDAHSFEEAQSIERALTGAPNVLVSRVGFEAAGETARLGDGHYTNWGKAGNKGGAHSVQYLADLGALYPRDFEFEHNQFVWKNRGVLRLFRPIGSDVSREVELSAILKRVADWVRSIDLKNGSLEKNMIFHRALSVLSARLSGASPEEIALVRDFLFAQASRAHFALWFALPLAYQEGASSGDLEFLAQDQDLVEIVFARMRYDFGLRTAFSKRVMSFFETVFRLRKNSSHEFALLARSGFFSKSLFSTKQMIEILYWAAGKGFAEERATINDIFKAASGFSELVKDRTLIREFYKRGDRVPGFYNAVFDSLFISGMSESNSAELLFWINEYLGTRNAPLSELGTYTWLPGIVRYLKSGAPNKTAVGIFQKLSGLFGDAFHDYFFNEPAREIPFQWLDVECFAQAYHRRFESGSLGLGQKKKVRLKNYPSFEEHAQFLFNRGWVFHKSLRSVHESFQKNISGISADNFIFLAHALMSVDMKSVEGRTLVLGYVRPLLEKYSSLSPFFRAELNKIIEKLGLNCESALLPAGN